MEINKPTVTGSQGTDTTEWHNSAGYHYLSPSCHRCLSAHPCRFCPASRGRKQTHQLLSQPKAQQWHSSCSQGRKTEQQSPHMKTGTATTASPLNCLLPGAAATRNQRLQLQLMPGQPHAAQAQQQDTCTGTGTATPVSWPPRICVQMLPLATSRLKLTDTADYLIPIYCYHIASYMFVQVASQIPRRTPTEVATHKPASCARMLLTASGYLLNSFRLIPSAAHHLPSTASWLQPTNHCTPVNANQCLQLQPMLSQPAMAQQQTAKHAELHKWTLQNRHSTGSNAPTLNCCCYYSTGPTSPAAQPPEEDTQQPGQQHLCRFCPSNRGRNQLLLSQPTNQDGIAAALLAEIGELHMASCTAATPQIRLSQSSHTAAGEAHTAGVTPGTEYLHSNGTCNNGTATGTAMAQQWHLQSQTCTSMAQQQTCQPFTDRSPATGAANPRPTSSHLLQPQLLPSQLKQDTCTAVAQQQPCLARQQSHKDNTEGLCRRGVKAYTKTNSNGTRLQCKGTHQPANQLAHQQPNWHSKSIQQLRRSVAHQPAHQIQLKLTQPRVDHPALADSSKWHNRTCKEGPQCVDDSPVEATRVTTSCIIESDTVVIISLDIIVYIQLTTVFATAEAVFFGRDSRNCCVDSTTGCPKSFFGECSPSGAFGYLLLYLQQKFAAQVTLGKKMRGDTPIFIL